MGKFIFWVCLIGIIVYCVQNNLFAPVSNFFANIKGDIDYQKSYIPREPDKIDDRGILTIEENESKVVRRSGLGTVHSGR